MVECLGVAELGVALEVPGERHGILHGGSSREESYALIDGAVIVVAEEGFVAVVAAVVAEISFRHGAGAGDDVRVLLGTGVRQVATACDAGEDAHSGTGGMENALAGELQWQEHYQAESDEVKGVAAHQCRENAAHNERHNVPCRDALAKIEVGERNGDEEESHVDERFFEQHHSLPGEVAHSGSESHGEG